MSRAECSSLAGGVPVKAKVCWEMGGIVGESGSLSSSLRAATVKGLLRNSCVMGSEKDLQEYLRYPAPRFTKRD